MNWEDLKSQFLSENQDIIIKYRELPSVIVDTNIRKRGLGVWYKTNSGVAYTELRAWEIDGETYWMSGAPQLRTAETTAVSNFNASLRDYCLEKGVPYFIENSNPDAECAIVSRWENVSFQRKLIWREGGAWNETSVSISL